VPIRSTRRFTRTSACRRSRSACKRAACSRRQYARRFGLAQHGGCALGVVAFERCGDLRRRDAALHFLEPCGSCAGEPELRDRECGVVVTAVVERGLQALVENDRDAASPSRASPLSGSCASTEW
jgi:hypothetical protein